MVYVWRHQRPAYRTIQHVTRSCPSADPTRRVSRPDIVMLGAFRRRLARLALPRARHLSRPDIVRSGASRRRYALPRLALPRADRGIGLHHQSVRPALALWLKPSPDGLRLGSRERGRLRRPFNDFRRLTGLSREHILNGLDGLLDLLIRKRLNSLRMLKFQFFGNQRGANPQICCRRFRPHPHDGFCTPFTKILQQSLNERLAEHVTSTLRIPADNFQNPKVPPTGRRICRMHIKRV
jgi:hypothetical protein